MKALHVILGVRVNNLRLLSLFLVRGLFAFEELLAFAVLQLASATRSICLSTNFQLSTKQAQHDRCWILAAIVL